ncbi:MAG: B12-binding domain-containing radical SAM protein [Planctomycetes bacterium]|nr:B12-binding domain-containing radical SAM protein [Planctomycetota bacterium]
MVQNRCHPVLNHARKTCQILLLQPWVEDFYSTGCRIQPIGLGYLAASILRRFPSLDVRIFDALAGGGRRTIPWPRELEYLRPFFGHPDGGPFSLFHSFYRFGRSDEEILARLREHRPLLIGISSLFTPYYRESLRLARLCRRALPGVPIAMGGSHATLHPRSLLHPPPPFEPGENLCDFVLRGEAEESIVELVAALRGERPLGGIPGLVTRDAPEGGGADPVTPRRDALPLPEFPGLDPDDYKLGRRRMSFLLASRSCPHRCSFCSIHAVFGRRYETRAVESILAEIELRYREGVRHFDFEDDNLTFDREHALALLDGIIELNLPATFSAMNGLSHHSLDEEILERMRRAGFETLNISLVSSDEAVLRFSERPHGVEQFLRILDAAARLDLRTTAYFVIGMPGQTLDEMWSTLKLLAGARCLIGASPFYFTPGSPIHRMERDNPRIRLASAGRDPFFSARLTALDLETDEFDRTDIFTLLRLARVINHIKDRIDRGIAPEHESLAAARSILAEGRWRAAAKGQAADLPFSSRIAERIRRDPLLVRGYRTDRLWRRDP